MLVLALSVADYVYYISFHLPAWALSKVLLGTALSIANMKSFTACSLLGALGLACAAPATQEYDYVIVGGGVSGLVVANRLSENEQG